MQLSGNLFKQIVSQLKSATAAADRREKPRVGMRNRVTLALLGGSDGKTVQSLEVGVKDLSPGGIGLMHHTPLPEDTIFAIRLPLRGSRDMTVVYKVKNCQPLGGDLFRIGASLIKMDDPAVTAVMPAKVDLAAAPVGAVAVAAK